MLLEELLSDATLRMAGESEGEEMLEINLDGRKRISLGKVLNKDVKKVKIEKLPDGSLLVIPIKS